MGEKRYFWLKLKVDFFTQPKIKKLRRMAGGDTFTIIYFKLQLLSLKNKGILLFEGIEETFAEELALTIDESLEDVKATLAFMALQNLIIQNSEDEFVLPETIELIGSETESAARVRKYREQKKQLSLQCDSDVTVGNTDIDIYEEINLDQDQNQDTQLQVEVEEHMDVSGTSEFQMALKEFVAFRKESKYPLTGTSLKKICDQLCELARDDTEKVAILRQSIRNGWKDVFPLRKYNENAAATRSYKYGKTKFQNYKPAEYDFFEIERLERERREKEEK